MRHALSSLKLVSMAALMAAVSFGVSDSFAGPQTSSDLAEFQVAEVLQPNIFFTPPGQRGKKERKAEAETQKATKQAARAEQKQTKADLKGREAAETQDSAAPRMAARAVNEPEIEETALPPLPSAQQPLTAQALQSQAPLKETASAVLAQRDPVAPRQGWIVDEQNTPEVAASTPVPANPAPAVQNQEVATISPPSDLVQPAQPSVPEGYEYTPYVPGQTPNRQVVPATAPTTQPAITPAAPASAQTISPGGTITVALLTPNTDPRPGVKALAESLTKAAALAAQEIGDRRLILRGYDTAGTPERAVIAAEQALADGAQLIIGPLFANNAVAVANVVQPYGVNTISFTTDRTVLRRGLYSLGYLPETEIERIIGFSARQGVNSLAVLAPETAYGNLVYAEVQNAALRHSVDLLRFQSFQPIFDAMDQTATDFAGFYAANSEVDEEGELIAAPIDGLLLAASGKSLQALAAYLAFRDVLPSDVKYMGLGLWDNAETFREATLRGGWFPGVDPLLRAEFEAAYNQNYGEEPSAIAGLGYDAVIVSAALIQAAGPNLIAPFSINAIERPMGFNGMSGPFRFLGDGRNDRQLSILRVGRREFEVIEAAPTGFQRQTEFGGLRQ